MVASRGRYTAGRRQSLREQVLEDIRAEIVSGRVDGGHVYSVPALASDLGVSSTPVREALLELHRKGLVSPLPNRGFEVVAPTTAELLDMLKLREMLETFALELIVERKPRDLSSLYAVASRISDAVDRGDSVGYVAADREFHLELVEMAGISKLTEFISELRDHMRLVGIETGPGLDRQKESVAEHFQLLDELGAGNLEGVRRVIAHHIAEWERVLRAGTASDASAIDEPISRSLGGSGHD